MDLNALNDFLLVAAHGGFGRASRAGRRSKATLSRRVADLEEQLGVRLIERGTKGLALTEAGQQLLDRTEGPMHEVTDAFTALGEGLDQVRGRVRIAAPLLFSQLAMGRIAAELQQQHPQLMIDVVAEDRVVDLVAERFDVAIRPNPRLDASLVGRCFATDRLLAVAAPGLSRPSDSEVPIAVPAVLSGREPDQWVLDDGRLTLSPQPVLRLSSMLMTREAALAGAGVAVLPQSAVWQQLARGELVSWGALQGPPVALWVLHTSRRLASPKVRAVVDFLCARYPDGVLVLSG